MKIRYSSIAKHEDLLETVKEDELFKSIEDAIGKAVDEQSAEDIKRVVVTEDDIVVEKM